MKKIVVTTTINKPTEALKKYASLKDWHLIVVPDLKTPLDEYKDLNCALLTVEEQKDKYSLISEYIGWNKTERRNLGYIKAYEMGADIIATVDDDNIPYSDWGMNVNLDVEQEIPTYENINGVFEPLSVTNKSFLWHRGYPLQLVNHRHENKYLGVIKRKFLVQADLWNGEPDIDAIYRLTNNYSNEDFKTHDLYSSINISPFNSQNTFIHRKAIKHYMMPINIGRIQDIWAAYYLQKKLGNVVLYGKASVFQRRNQHIILNDYLEEYKTYHLSLDFINDKLDKNYVYEIEKGYDIYQSYFTEK
jgi:hypothetical protein